MCQNSALSSGDKMDSLKEGETAPTFSLKDKDGVVHSLNDVKSNFTVVYFYPKDNTPGCTIEAKRFNDDKSKYDQLDTTVIGISGGDEKTKTKFCTKYDLKLILLSDTDAKVGEGFGVYGEKKFLGKKYMGYGRVTFVLDKNKKIIKVYEKVKPLSHSKEILEFLQGQS